MRLKYVAWHGALWRVDTAVGFYERLVSVAPEACEPHPVNRLWPKWREYAQMYRAGSPFPPIVVLGPRWPGDSYQICNGHHRWRAAMEVGAPRLQAWMSFSIQRTYSNGHTCWETARVVDTKTGHIIAAQARLDFCPQCGTLQNYDVADGDMCWRCRVALEKGCDG